MNGISAPLSGYPLFPLNELLSALFAPPHLSAPHPYQAIIRFGTCLFWDGHATI